MAASIRLLWCGALITLASPAGAQPRSVPPDSVPPPLEIERPGRDVVSEDVLRTLWDGIVSVRVCAERGGAARADLLVTLSIAPAHVAARVSVSVAGARASADLRRCVQAALRPFRFPDHVGRGEVTLRFHHAVGVLAVLRGPPTSPPASPPAEPNFGYGGLGIRMSRSVPSARVAFDTRALEVLGGDRTRQAVIRALAGARRDLGQCAQQQLERAEGARGVQRFALVVRDTGTVLGVTWEQPIVGSEAMRSCMAVRLRRLNLGRGSTGRIRAALRLSVSGAAAQADTPIPQGAPPDEATE